MGALYSRCLYKVKAFFLRFGAVLLRYAGASHALLDSLTYVLRQGFADTRRRVRGSHLPVAWHSKVNYVILDSHRQSVIHRLYRVYTNYGKTYRQGERCIYNPRYAARIP